MSPNNNEAQIYRRESAEEWKVESTLVEVGRDGMRGSAVDAHFGLGGVGVKRWLFLASRRPGLDLKRTLRALQPAPSPALLSLPPRAGVDRHR